MTPEAPVSLPVRPKRILIISILFMIGGVLAGWNIISGLFNDSLNLNFAVFLLPVGIGLFRGKRSSHAWARFWMVLGYILAGLLIILPIIMPQNSHATWGDNQLTGDEAAPYVIAKGLVIASLIFILHRLLNSQRSRDYFDQMTVFCDARPVSGQDQIRG